MKGNKQRTSQAIKQRTKNGDTLLDSWVNICYVRDFCHGRKDEN